MQRVCFLCTRSWALKNSRQSRRRRLRTPGTHTPSWPHSTRTSRIWTRRWGGLTRWLPTFWHGTFRVRGSFCLGFSQGACLTLEFVARHPQRYGAVIGLTGGFIGPPGTARNYPGSLAGTPAFLGTSDPDPHVPFERVKETEAVLGRMGAKVELRRYPGMPHTINDDELDACRQLLKRVVAANHPKN